MPGTPTCDLHTHTLHSDGALTPEELVDLAVENGVTALALTDHDTLDGIPAAQRHGAARGLEVIAGIELSVDEQGIDVHLLGYFVSRPEVLRSALDALGHERRARAQRIVDKLAELGVEIEYAAVTARAIGGVVGRPHVAAELVERGHVPTIEAAFDVYLGFERPAYVAKAAMGLAQAAALLRAAGAVPVVAHPGASAVEPLLPELRAAGVLGLEVWHPKHDARLVRRYLDVAQRMDLLPTGGSDFHRIAPGCFRPGDLGVPLAVLDALRPHAS